MKLSVLLKNKFNIDHENKKMIAKFNEFCNKQSTCKNCIYGELIGNNECLVKFAEEHEIEIDLE